MKGAKLTTFILLPTVILLCVVMAIISPENSASSNHMTMYDPLLYAFLISMIIALLNLYHTAVEKELHLAQVVGINIKLKHGLIYTMWAFVGVLIFGVNNEASIFGVSIYALHLIFTGIGIFFGNLLMLFYAKTPQERKFSYYKTGFSLIGFALGFIFNLYSTTWAEVFAALPIAYTAYLINKKK